MAPASCTFAFDPAEHERSHPDVELPETDLTDDGRWECPHEPLEGRERCLAHADAAETPAGIDETDWLLEAVERDSAVDTQRDRHRRKQFLGGRFRDLDVSSSVPLQDDYPLDLRYCTIDSFSCTAVALTRTLEFGAASVGELSMEGEFEQLRGMGAEIDALGLDEARVQRLELCDGTLEQVSLRNGTVAVADLREATVGKMCIDESSITRGNFDDAAFGTLRGRHASLSVADFDGATFETVDFYYADFGQADFRGVVATDAVFKGADFDGAYFNDAEIEVGNWLGVEIENAHFSGAQFDQAAFRGAAIESADFPDCHFGWLNFQHARLENATFADSIFEHATFRDAAFDTADFTGIDPAGALTLSETVFEDELLIQPAPAFRPLDSVIDLRDSRIPAGVLTQSERGRTIYDLKGALVGNVRFEGDDADGNLVGKIRFLRTRFERFDFRDSDDIDLKRTQHVLHEMFDGAEDVAGRLLRYGLRFGEARDRTELRRQTSGGEVVPLAESEDYRDLRARVDDRLSSADLPPRATVDYRTPSTRDLEYTYLLAKNGANALHDNESASMFFIREMQQRRNRHAELAAEAGGIRDAAHHRIDWAKNSILRWSAGYGERPSNVIATSVAVIVAFSGLYYAVSPSLYENPLNFVILSAGSFVTLIVGGVGNVPSTTINLLSQIQAFVGAFLIAMFVFTLTRSIHR